MGGPEVQTKLRGNVVVDIPQSSASSASRQRKMLPSTHSGHSCHLLRRAPSTKSGAQLEAAKPEQATPSASGVDVSQEALPNAEKPPASSPSCPQQLLPSTYAGHSCQILRRPASVPALLQAAAENSQEKECVSAHQNQVETRAAEETAVQFAQTGSSMPSHRRRVLPSTYAGHSCQVLYNQPSEPTPARREENMPNSKGPVLHNQSAMSLDIGAPQETLEIVDSCATASTRPQRVLPSMHAGHSCQVLHRRPSKARLAIMEVNGAEPTVHDKAAPCDTGAANIPTDKSAVGTTSTPAPQRMLPSTHAGHSCQLLRRQASAPAPAVAADSDKAVATEIEANGTTNVVEPASATSTVPPTMLPSTVAGHGCQRLRRRNSKANLAVDVTPKERRMSEAGAEHSQLLNDEQQSGSSPPQKQAGRSSQRLRRAVSEAAFTQHGEMEEQCADASDRLGRRASDGSIGLSSTVPASGLQSSLPSGRASHRLLRQVYESASSAAAQDVAAFDADTGSAGSTAAGTLEASPWRQPQRMLPSTHSGHACQSLRRQAPETVMAQLRERAKQPLSLNVDGLRFVASEAAGSRSTARNDALENAMSEQRKSILPSTYAGHSCTPVFRRA